MAFHTLTHERFARLRSHFDTLIALEADARDAALADIAATDAPLAEQLRGLLAAHDQTGAALDRPIAAEAIAFVEQATDPWVGTRLGPWEITRRIGAGGMGTVYEAARADDQYRTRVAIKLLGQHSTSELAIERFRLERQILASLHHPHIASLLDGGVTPDGQPWFAMEFIEGEPITRWCDARALTIRERLALFRQVCAAMQHAHQGLVIHLDLKPANILVSTDGTVKVLDFGIAKLMPAQDDADATVTRFGARAFTPDYASPEQLIGDAVGTRSDVYAAGVVLFELLTGALPFERRGLSPLSLERTLRTTTAPRPSAAMPAQRAALLGESSHARARKRIAGDLDAIVLAALHDEPERRYASMADLSADIGRFLDGKPVAARPDGWTYRFGKLIRRRRAESAAIAVALLATVAGLVGVVVQGRTAERERTRATEVAQFLRVMLGAASPESFGRDVKVREVLDSAAVRANALDDRPAIAAEIRQVIGDTYLALGEFPLAEAQFRKAVALLDGADARGTRTTASSLTRLSMAMEFEGKYGAADTALQRAAAIYEREGFPDEEARSDLADARGRLLAQLGDLAGAERAFRAAVDIQRAVVPRRDSALANLLGNLGFVTSELGRHAEAESLYLEGIAAARRAYGDTHPLVASLMSPLATVQERLGAMARADSTYRAVLGMRATLLGEEHPDYAWTMLNYADHLMVTARYPDAAKWARRAIALRGRTLNDAHPVVATAMNVLGRSLARMDSARAAEPWLRESLAIRRRELPTGHFLIASAESILGEGLTAARRFAEAEPLLLRGEQALTASRGEGSPLVQDARKRLVTLYEAWGKPQQAAQWRAKGATMSP
ncbi:MAG: serine/threonine-protein kinase [Gemmatimonadetes bacterium]|nr:serine/threonine-protein kinase [Gemmatimonadota bacterium]